MEHQSLVPVLILTIAIFANVSLAVFQSQRNGLQFRQQKLFEIQEDAVLTVPGLIAKYGYPVEEHSVTTEDGYILSMYRIPHAKSGPSHNRPVVYIQHGFLSNSAEPLLSGPENALGKFRNFDYGTVGNLKIYNGTEPPDYDLSKVTAPVAIYCSENDWQSSAVDADQLFQELGNPIGKFVLAERPNHYSYFNGKNMRQILYSRMVEVMRRY
ncbi:Lipase 4 [Carabus blaptoides fortunei]